MNEKVSAWAGVSVLKNGLIDNIVKEIGDRKIDLSGEYMKLFAVEHHCNEMVEGDVQMISSSGFTLDSYCDELVWKDMIVEDLAMVLDYLRTGNW
jgi:hypothetical protein